MLEQFNRHICQEAETLRKKTGTLLNEDGNEKLIGLVNIALDWCEENDIYPNKIIQKVRETLKDRFQYSFYADEGVIFISGSGQGWFKDFIEMMEYYMKNDK